MSENINEINKPEQPNGSPRIDNESAIADKAHILGDILTPKNDPGHLAVSDDTTRAAKSTDIYANLIPLITLFQAPGRINSVPLDKNLITKIEAHNSSVYKLKAILSQSQPVYEYNVINPPGLYGPPGKSFGKMNANPPQEYRVLLGFNQENFPTDPKSKANTLWYGGAVPDADKNLFDFSAVDYHSPDSHSLLYRLVQYDHHDGVGPNFIFQGLPHEVGRNVHSMDIIRSKDGKTFKVEVTSYPQWSENTETGQLGWVPVRTKITMGTDGNVIPQVVNGKKLSYVRTVQNNDWRYDANAWKNPFLAPWWGPPK